MNNKYYHKHHTSNPNKSFITYVCDHLDGIDCARQCKPYSCVWALSVPEHNSMISNPLKWCSTHLQSQDSKLKYIAKLILEDRVIL